MSKPLFLETDAGGLTVQTREHSRWDNDPDDGYETLVVCVGVHWTDRTLYEEHYETETDARAGHVVAVAWARAHAGLVAEGVMG